MRGTVNAYREPTLVLQIRAATGTFDESECVIDTGFSGFVALAPEQILALGWPFIATAKYELADGSEVVFAVYRGTVIWDGLEYDVNVLASSGGDLVGMGMLYGYRVVMDIVDGGDIVIEALA